MSTSGLEHIFISKKMQAQQFMERWGTVKESMSQTFGEERSEILSQLYALDLANQNAYNTLAERLPSAALGTP